MMYSMEAPRRRSKFPMAAFLAIVFAAIGAWFFRSELQSAIASALGHAGAGRHGGASPYGAADLKLTAPNPVGGPANPFLANGDAIVRGLNAIAARSGRPLRLTNLQADTVNGLTAEVQEPRDHVRVDEYAIAIDGTITGPTPVALSGQNGHAPTAADVDYNSFDPATYRLTGLASAIRAAIAQSKVSDARVSSWQMDRAWGEYQWGLTMDAARSHPNVTLRRDASIEGIGF